MKTAVNSPDSADSADSAECRRGLAVYHTETPPTGAPEQLFRPHFPAFRSGLGRRSEAKTPHRLFLGGHGNAKSPQRPSSQKQFPSSNPISTHSRLQAGFTLTELLVVIVIIATLAALSFVGVNSIRQSAQLSACAANLRTWGIAIRGYSADNNGQVVWRNWASIGSADRYYESYLGGDSVAATATKLHRRCPSVKWDGKGNGPVGYAMTRPNPKTSNSSSYNLGTVGNPSQLLMLIDGTGLVLNGPDDMVNVITPLTVGASPRHKKTVNALFGDGHVSSYGFGEIAGNDSAKKAMRERWFSLN
jgi:prepilin-type N-terminal cleavage/methylation domain-containing protein/prepilin-type processing-associated H-X9-DG protein